MAGVLLEAVGENPFPCLLQLLEGLIPWFVATSHPSSSSSFITRPPSPSDFLASRVMGPCDDIYGPCGLSKLILWPMKNPICKVLLPMSGNIYRFQTLECGLF